MDLKDIKAIIDLMRKNAVSEFELEKEGFKIRLKRAPVPGPGLAGEEAGPGYSVLPGAIPPLLAGGSMTPAATVTPPSVAGASSAAAPAGSTGPAEVEIKSPMIGTFYRAPSPEAAPYVEVGSEVHPDTVVCIIEAMKVMNEIKAEMRGVITAVLVENAKPVEFGQPLFKVRPL
ncbi:MAG: acetyl-CoA carboxylase biotin carboxyl carrier protein [Verrucomicrobiota bacterium]|nr:acetyl-CoA carboxylase biotin carboxyl carrier protein [Limisphaera sp.]MDW8381096.1 acetyl-CoA carboxylase biotin carboxyl carrier protein [Verrucomicrobiota bacterium]